MAQATMAAIAGLKETYVQLKTRMEKAVEDFRKAMAATRTGRATCTCWTASPWTITARRCR